MPRATPAVALQPASPKPSSVDRENYNRTIVRPVAFDQYSDVMDPKALAILLRLFPSGEAKMWGIRPGVTPKNWKPGSIPMNRRRFAELKVGDTVVFAGGSRLYFSATVAHKWTDPGLAEALWKTDKGSGQTWELMYALIGGETHDVPLSEFRAAAEGWGNDERSVRNFEVLDQKKSKAVHDLLQLKPTAAPMPDEPDDGAAAQSGWFEGELERILKRVARGEQPAIRRLLIPEAVGTCALCGREFPSGFLVAAHIKKRAYCSDQEKADIANIGMAACRFGCDELYERGYITVAADGRIDVSYQAADSPAVAEYIRNHLEGRKVERWTLDREAYFNWHRVNTFRTDLRVQ